MSFRISIKSSSNIQIRSQQKETYSKKNKLKQKKYSNQKNAAKYFFGYFFPEPVSLTFHIILSPNLRPFFVAIACLNAESRRYPLMAIRNFGSRESDNYISAFIIILNDAVHKNKYAVTDIQSDRCDPA